MGAEDQSGQEEKSEEKTGSLHRSPLLGILDSVGVKVFEWDAFGTRGRVEGERCIVVRRRQVPDEGGGVFWPGIVGKGPDDKLSWKREVSQLNPDLPVEALLTK